MKSSIVTLMFVLFLATQVHAQREGIHGEVFWVGGNQMPGPGRESNPQQGVVREIYIYEPTKLKDTEQVDGFFTTIKTTLIAKVVSEKDGSFQIKLQPGEYSIFVKEEKGMYANLFDKDGTINAVTVKSKKFSWVTIAIDYEAVF